MQAKFSLLGYVNGTYVTIDPKKRNVEGATRFYARYTDENGKRHKEPLGGDFAHACAELVTMEAARDYELKTGKKLPGKEVQSTESKPTELTAAIRHWLEKKRIDPEMAKSTIALYTFGLAKFEEFAKGRIRNVSEITADDLFLFAAKLKEQGMSRRTILNYFRYTVIFLKANGVHLGIASKYYTDQEPRKPQEYKPHELKALFAKAMPEEKLLFDSFYWTGMRNKEMANLTYGDIDFQHSTWEVQRKDKPNHAWRTKSKAGNRWIPVPPTHTKLIEERMIRLKKSEDDLVFPDEFGRVNNNYLPILKDLAKRAGLRGRVDIHKFRSTCATRWLREGRNIMQVATWLGHGDLKSMKAYAAMVEKESKETMQQTDKSYREREKMFQAADPESVIPFRATGT